MSSASSSSVPRSLTPGPLTLRGMRKRWWLFRTLDLLARYWPVFGPRRGLLVVRIDGIGDMVMFRWALDHYAEAFGVAPSDITVLGCNSWAGLADTLFAGYRVYPIDEGKFDRSPFYRFKIGLWVRRQRFAIASCDSYFRKALVADSLIWFSAAPRRVLTQPWISRKTRAEFAYYQRGAAPAIDTGPYPTHEIVRHASYVSQIGGKPIAPRPPSLPAFAGRPPAAMLPDGPAYVVLNFGCNEAGRRWPFANFETLALRLLEVGLRVVFVGTVKEAGDIARRSDLLARPGVINLVGQTSLVQIGGVFAHAAAVVTNDTGPGHLSIALGAPTLMLVGGGHFTSFVPYPESIRPATARFIHAYLPCYHCFWNCTQPRAPGSSFPCLVAVPLEQAWAELQDLLGLKRASL